HVSDHGCIPVLEAGRGQVQCSTAAKHRAKKRRAAARAHACRRAMSAENTFDVIVVGAGPAGSAAAIQCATAGLNTLILEREAFPRDRPGETLQPGIQPVLEQLGIRDLPFPRHAGHWVEWGGPARFERFGADERGPW